MAFVLLFTSPAIIGMMFVQDATGFIICRGIIGIGLASFVACQVWCSQMFSKSVVGVANATAGGWGNLGGGITTLCMPFIYRAFMSATNDDENLSWRLCFIVPLVLHVLGAIAALTGRDLPDGNYKELEVSGAKQKSDSGVVAKVGLSNINAWILTITYALCFGVELTMTNVVTLYFYEYHAFSQIIAGTLGSIFGLVNIFARSLGGITSDWANRKFGMRGRIWALWIWQTIEGILCVIMGLVTLGMKAPQFTEAKDVVGYTQIGGTWYPFDGNSSTVTFSRIVPFVSRPALGVVSGMVGAVGNAGALVTNAAFFISDGVRTDTGFVNMGIFVIAGTLLLYGCYFPEMGGMLFKAGSIKYDPQLIKPPAGYKGSDEITIKAAPDAEQGVKETPAQAEVAASKI